MSLAELLVVVAIVGILGAVAVPNFQAFMAKAKQAYAKSELAGIFVGQKTYFIENDTYHSNLPFTGFVADGYPMQNNGCPGALLPNFRRFYTVGFGTDAPPGPAQVNAPSMSGVAPPLACNLYNNRTSYFDSSEIVPAVLPNTTGARPTQFRAGARGKIGNAPFDYWTIDENRNLFNNIPGF